MKKNKSKRSVLFSRIREENKHFILKQMAKFNYPKGRGQSKYVDDVFSALRNHRSPTQLRRLA